MKKWAVLALVAALAGGGGVVWALATRGGNDSSGTPSFAERIAAVGEEPSEDAGGLILDRCYNLAPLFDESGALNPDLAAFPARLLSDDFELTAVRFGDLCHQSPPTRMLETEWKHRKTGAAVMIDQYAGGDAPTRIAPLYASFTDNGFNFHVMSLSLLGYPGVDIDPATAHRMVEVAVRQLRPPVPLSCFYRSVSKDWADLAALGIGDPRAALPAGYGDVRLDFTALETPPADCPPTSPPPPAEPEVQLQAMFSGPGNSLLAILARSLTPNDAHGQATFGRGGASWQNAKFAFSINWAPEHVSDDEARAIATALDHGFGTVCSLSARSVGFSEISQPGLREPVPPGGLAALVTGTFVLVGHSPGCPDGSRVGFQAHWLMQYRDRAGLVDVTALNGEQMPNMRPMVFEDKTLYWKRGDGVAFYVSGLKAEFSRDELLEIARSVDATFDESLVSAPPLP